MRPYAVAVLLVAAVCFLYARVAQRLQLELE